jgi:pimeloyl-ACP methyl ester carboxylesterase
MYAHGYAGTGPDLVVQNPTIRRYLIQNRYAWAASSYSKNFYDVRAGVEDTNALAQAFTQIAAQNGQALRQPDRIYITGHSMGGHIAAAAVEAETLATAVNQVRYDGAVPMCGVMGDTELFNTFAAMQLAAQTLAGVPDHPFTQWGTVANGVTGQLFNRFPAEPTLLGQEYLSVVKNLTGGQRPLFDEGVAFGGSFPSAYGSFGDDGTINGILNESVLDTRHITYPYTDNQGNAQTLDVSQVLTPAEGANRLRSDGLRWIPQLAGNIGVPVVSIHTLGDLFVPFNMQQVYRQRVAAQGKDEWLVQRAIRGASHCDFTVAEQERAFSDMVGWVNGGPQPAGDNVLNPAVVASPAYGCTFTNNTLGVDDSPAVANLRNALVPTRAACLTAPGG